MLMEGNFGSLLSGGLVAPVQGLFPKYKSGAYTQNQSTMIISRGLGHNIHKNI
jgi:predicted MPP superfamily phosphohydrolase